MAVDPEHPVDVGGNFGGDLTQRPGQLKELILAGVAQVRQPLGKQDLGLEDEAVADDAHARLGAQYVAEPAEKLRTVTAEFMHLGGKRRVQS